MAERKPLVLIGSTIRQLPTGDTVEGATGLTGYVSEYTGVTETVPVRHQKLVYGKYEIEGVLVLEGKMVLV
jgi:predicted extracellular nuclease